MNRKYLLSLLPLLLLSSGPLRAASQAGLENCPDAQGRFVPADPYLYDPVSGDLGDPTIIFDHQRGNAWVFYTQRPHWKIAGPGWYHGAPIGILSSGLGGYSWLYRGTAEGLAGAFEPGTNTYWAPEVIYHEGKYHMYVSYRRGVPLHTGPNARKYMKDEEDHRGGGVLYFTSTDLIRWSFVRRLALAPDNGSVIDPCVHPLPDGTWRMWYRGLATNEGTDRKVYCNYADSRDLVNWTSRGSAIELDGYAEAAYVFHWKGYYWMLLDGMNPKKYGGYGLAVFRSTDATAWEFNGGILDDGDDPQKRLVWGGRGGHGSVALQGENEAYVIYQASMSGKMPCVGQIARLVCQEGKLSAVRDFGRMKLEGVKAPAFRGGRAPNFLK